MGIVLFSILYFVIFYYFIDLIFRNTLSAFTDLLAVVCCLIAFVVSVGLADFTVKKINDKYRKDE